MSQPLVFYDILVDASAKNRQTYSANTWKTRLVLNYKKIPYTTVWVEYADIQAVGKEIGAEITDIRPTGEPRYTLPAIRNPATGEAVADSAKIIAYLEDRYPERPLIPAGTLEQQIAFGQEVYGIIGPELLAFATGTGATLMTPRSVVAFERLVRSFDHGPPFAERTPPPPEAWTRVQEGFSRLAQRYDGRKYMFGEQMTYADCLVASAVLTLYPTVSEARQAEMRTWDGGRWKELIDEFQAAGYTAADHGEVYVAPMSLRRSATSA